mgnify:CR=1 FL=1
MIMLMAGAVACFVAVSLAVSVASIVSVLLKSVVMVCWMDIVAYNHPVKSITRKGLSADLSFLSAGLRFFSLTKMKISPQTCSARVTLMTGKQSMYQRSWIVHHFPKGKHIMDERTWNTMSLMCKLEILTCERVTSQLQLRILLVNFLDHLCLDYPASATMKYFTLSLAASAAV